VRSPRANIGTCLAPQRPVGRAGCGPGLV